MIPNDPIDQQPDAQTGGSSFMNSVENLGEGAILGGLAVLDTSLAGGRYPYDPSNPNFGAVRPPVASSAANKTSSNFLLLALLIFAVTR